MLPGNYPVVTNPTHKFKVGLLEEVMFKLNPKGSVEVCKESWELRELSQQCLGKGSNMNKCPEAGYGMIQAEIVSRSKRSVENYLSIRCMLNW